MNQNTQDRPLLVLCTCPDRSTGLALARRLVDQRLAACVNVLEGLTSVFRWRGDLQEEGEVLLLAKTRAGCYDALEALIRKHHPYELPEVIALSVDRGLGGYLDWVVSETRASDAKEARST